MTELGKNGINDVDALLRDSFARLATPGDPAGVAEAIRTRMDAGDIGTPASTLGFGGGSGGPWLLWGAVIAIAGLLGGGLGLSGLVGAPQPERIQLTVLAVDAATDAYDCPGGSAVSSFSANERALVVARTEDSQWLAVRDSYDYSRTVWLPASVVTVDADQGDVESVAVRDCAAPIVVVNTPEPEETEAPDAKPQITGVTQSAKEIHQTGTAPDQVVVNVAAVDDKAVKSVQASWPESDGIPAGSANAVYSGGTWNFTFGPFPNPNGYSSETTITIVAVDSTGQRSAARTISVSMSYVLI